MKGGGKKKGARARRSVPVNSIPKTDPKPKPSSADVAEIDIASIGVRSSGNLCVEEEYVYGQAGARYTTYAYTRVDSPVGLLDLPAVGLQQLSKLSACARVHEEEVETRIRKPAGEGGNANTHKRAHRAREYSTMTGLVALSGGPV